MEFKKKFTWWDIREQQDAHECFVNFIDLLQSVTKDKSCSLTFESSRNGYSKYIQYINSNPSIMSKLYYGLSSNYVKCTMCNNLSSSYEIINSVNVEVPEENCYLSDLLQKYITKEKHDDPDNLYHCDKCNKKVTMTKKTGFYKLPKILVVCLKRYNYSSYPPKKINTIVDYPVDGLRIREQFSDKVKEYSLENIILHFGGFFGGHYTCVNRINNQWFNFDDENIRTVNESGITKIRQAYILTYRCLQ